MPSLHGKLRHFPGASVDLTNPDIGVLLPDLVMTRCGGIDWMLLAERGLIARARLRGTHRHRA
jgi:hypothetical protein